MLDRTRGALTNIMGAALKDLYYGTDYVQMIRPSLLGEATVFGGYRLMETSYTFDIS